MKIHRFIFKIAAFTSLFFFAQNALAQVDLPSEQVEVIKIFEAQLAESEKIGVNPELPAADTTIKKQTYDVPAKTFDIEYQAPRIRPITHKSDEEIAEVYKAYLKLGGGLPKSIYGEGAYDHFHKSEKNAYQLGLNLLRHQADYSSGEVENQKFAYTKGELKGTYYFPKGYAASAKMGVTSNKIHYYGYNFDRFNEYEGVASEAVEQVFSTFDLGAKIFNGVQTAGDLNYNAGLDFYNHSDNFAASEQGFDLKLGATKWINGKHSFDLGIRTDFTWYNDTLETAQTLHNYTLAPVFTFHADKLKIKVGGKLVSNNDEFFPFPDIELVYNLTGNELAFYAGLEGDLKKNTFRSLTEYNPFVTTRYPGMTIKNTQYYHGFAGVRGNLKFFEYTLQAGFKPTNDLAIFKTNYEDDLKYTFDVVYDDFDIINFSGSIKAVPLKGLEITGTLSQNIFKVQGDEPKAFHLPSLEATIQALYMSKDGKLKTKAALYVENGVTTNTGISRYESLNGLFDISLGAEYWFHKNFGAFIDVNNLLNNERQRWRYYPTYGINVLGGISLRF